MNSITDWPHTFSPGEQWGSIFENYIDACRLYLPDNWDSGLVLPGPADIDTEADCVALVKSVSSRTPDLRAAIEFQALPRLSSFRDVQMVLGEPKAANRRMVGALVEEIQSPIFILKQRYNRGRPWQCCSQDLDPMFRKPSVYYPAHPAYPSGHATIAYAWAYLLSEIDPSKSSLFVEKAKCIAVNREVAGLHYQTDSEAGRILAKHLVKKLLDVPTFRTLVKATCVEWGATGPACQP